MGLAELLGGGSAESPFLWHLAGCTRGWRSGLGQPGFGFSQAFSGTEGYQKKEQECNTIVLPILVPNMLRPQLKTHTGLQGRISSL